jgi:citrate/tricarballylate utilization protein
VTGQVTANAAAQTEAASDVLTLRYLDGGHGEGCHNEDEAYTLSRRRAHHATFYGFLLCFAATSVATLQHYLFGMPAPYDWPALPKLLGVPGGVLLALGAARLLWLNWQRHPLHGDVQQRPMDRAFLVLLLLTSVSGLGLWLARTHTSMPLWLCVHLGSVMALFLTLPYGKMVHGFYRSAALLRYAVEKRLPNPIGLGND